MKVECNSRSSIGWLPDHHVVCTEVCDAQEPAVSTICAREIDPTTSPTTHARAGCACNGYDVTKVECNTRSSIGRRFDHRVVCTEVCDAQEPAVSMICAREIDPTTSPTHMSELTTALDLRRATALPGGPVRATTETTARGTALGVLWMVWASGAVGTPPTSAGNDPPRRHLVARAA